MKAAFHFNSDHADLEGDYGWRAEKLIFSSLLRHPNLSIHSKIFAGDLGVWKLVKYEMYGPKDGELDSNRGRYSKLVDYWLHTGNSIRATIGRERLLQEAIEHTIYAVCFESIELSLVGYLHKALSELTDSYIGMIEIDDMSSLHWSLYSDMLRPSYRMMNKVLTIFWDNVSDADKPIWLLETCQELGFKTNFEGLNGRYTFFDKNYSFEHARREAEWKRRCGNMLAFVADNVVHRLEDVAPRLGEKLWAAIIAFEDAEIDEQYSQVAVSCRRIVEYVIDQLLPPTKKQIESHKKEFRERLTEFADKQRRDEEDINLICTSHNLLEEQYTKLSSLINRGVHREIYRDATRRCLLRTIVLLDDIVSLKSGAFEMRPDLDIDLDDVRNWL